MPLAGIHNGLAIYGFGAGSPALLMPDPEGASASVDVSSEALIDGLKRFGREVITFDPPQSGRSFRPARPGMEEMLACAEESLAFCGINRRVDAIGYCRGGLAALAFALERPQRVRRLVLICTAAAAPRPRLRRATVYRCLYALTGRLAAHRLLSNLSAAIPAGPHPIEWRDWLRPAPPRARWVRVARKLDYTSRLGEVCVPALVLAGLHDAQTTPFRSRELAAGIPGAALVNIEQSGHYPFFENPADFWAAMAEFLAHERQPVRSIKIDLYERSRIPQRGT